MQVNDILSVFFHFIYTYIATKPISKSSDVVGVAVGGALGGFLLGIIVTTVSVVGIYICYIRCYHRNSEWNWGLYVYILTYYIRI